jgi:hypothetical protein
MRKNYQYKILADVLVIPVPPIYNNPQQWWNINNYEILSAALQHEVETFLKSFSPYLPKEDRGFEPATHSRLVNLQPTISGLLLPKKSNNVTFPEAQPISSITSSTRLGTIIGTTSATPKELSHDWYPPQQPWNISHNDSDNLFDGEESLEEIVSTVQRPRGPPISPSDSSYSDKSGPDRNREAPKLSVATVMTDTFYKK